MSEEGMMDEKTAFQQRMEAELREWEAELERWREREEHADGDPQLRKEQQQMLDDLHEKRLTARRYLDELARGGDWSVFQPEMEQLWAEIRTEIAAIKTRA
jgi:DNA phosphorothioation-dependent restriction protein DptG